MFVACSDYSLSPIKPGKSNAQSKGSFCTYDPVAKDSYVNYMFVMDISGSNSSTDPSSMRMQKMMDYYDKKKTEPFIRWSAIKFNDREAAAIRDPNGEPNMPIFTDDLSITDPHYKSWQAFVQGAAQTILVL